MPSYQPKEALFISSGNCRALEHVGDSQTGVSRCTPYGYPHSAWDAVKPPHKIADRIFFGMEQNSGPAHCCTTS